MFEFHLLDPIGMREAERHTQKKLHRRRFIKFKRISGKRKKRNENIIQLLVAESR